MRRLWGGRWGRVGIVFSVLKRRGIRERKEGLALIDGMKGRERVKATSAWEKPGFDFEVL